MDNNTINTIQDFIDYLQTFDLNKPISGEYINVIGNHYISIKNMPLLKSLFEDTGDNIKIKAMFY